MSNCCTYVSSKFTSFNCLEIKISQHHWLSIYVGLRGTEDESNKVFVLYFAYNTRPPTDGCCWHFNFIWMTFDIPDTLLSLRIILSISSVRNLYYISWINVWSTHLHIHRPTYVYMKTYDNCLSKETQNTKRHLVCFICMLFSESSTTLFFIHL